MTLRSVDGKAGMSIAEAEQDLRDLPSEWVAAGRICCRGCGGQSRDDEWALPEWRAAWIVSAYAWLHDEDPQVRPHCPDCVIYRLAVAVLTGEVAIARRDLRQTN
jgi:hypothetical protein